MAVLGSDNLSHSANFKFNISTNTVGQFSSTSLLLGSAVTRIFTGDDPRLIKIENIAGVTGERNSGISIVRNSTLSASAPVIDFLRTRATTEGGVTSVVSGDNLGVIRFHATNGTAIADPSTSIEASATVSSGNIAGNFRIQTRNTSGTIAARFYIDEKDGNIVIGGQNADIDSSGNNQSRFAISEPNDNGLPLNLRHGGLNVQKESIRFSRSDAIFLRYHSIVTQNSNTQGSNYIAFNVHSASTETSQVRTITLTGDGNLGVRLQTTPTYALDVQDNSPTIARFLRTNGPNSVVRFQSNGGTCMAGADADGSFVVSNNENVSSFPYLLVNFAGSGSVSVGDNRIISSIGSTKGLTFIAGANPRIFAVVDTEHLFAHITTGVIMRFRTGTTNVGSISVTGSNTAYNTSSDYRLKENILPSAIASELIDAIKVRSFDWKVDGSHQRYGLVAQEVGEIYPESVTKGNSEDDMWSVDYSKFVPILLKEIQDLRARVLELEVK
jgi:hypothetical protein